MMKTRQSKLGFSLVEAIVAILTMAILSLTIGSLLVFGWLSWRRNTTSVDMQRDTSLAMRIMAKEIRNASNLTVNASALVCESTNTVSFVKSGRNLDMEVDGTLRMHLIRDAVVSYTPALTNSNGAVVNLGLAVNGDTVQVSETIYRRN